MQNSLPESLPDGTRMTVTPLTVIDLGHRPYGEIWALQKQMHRDLIAGVGSDTLLLVEHDPVVTMGRSSKADSLLISPEQIRARGIEVFEIERGGDVTYHGPGQLVAYPIVNLTKKKQDVHWYMRTLEEVVIKTLADEGIEAVRVTGMTGVWVSQADGSFAKISSLGVRISRWCTLHGLALNIFDCSEGFSVMSPCGLQGIRVTCLAKELYNRGNFPATLQFAQVKENLVKNFCTIFSYEQLSA